MFGEDERIAQWVQKRLPDFLGWNGAYRAVGYELRGQLKGGVVYSQYTGPNIMVATVLEAPLTRRFLRSIFFYPFCQLKCQRMTALIDQTNARSQRLVRHLGFKFEGAMREATPHGDMLIFGLLKRECRFLPVNHE